MRRPQRRRCALRGAHCVAQPDFFIFPLQDEAALGCAPAATWTDLEAAVSAAAHHVTLCEPAAGRHRLAAQRRAAAATKHVPPVLAAVLVTPSSTPQAPHGAAAGPAGAAAGEGAPARDAGGQGAAAEGAERGAASASATRDDCSEALARVRVSGAGASGAVAAEHAAKRASAGAAPVDPAMRRHRQEALSPVAEGGEPPFHVPENPFLSDGSADEAPLAAGRGGWRRPWSDASSVSSFYSSSSSSGGGSSSEATGAHAPGARGALPPPPQLGDAALPDLTQWLWDTWVYGGLEDAVKDVDTSRVLLVQPRGTPVYGSEFLEEELARQVLLCQLVTLAPRCAACAEGQPSQHKRSA